MIKTKTTILSENFFCRFADVFSPFLGSVGIDPKVLKRADIEIPEDRYVALWEAVGRENPSIGLEIGSQTNPEDIGATGHAMHCAPSVLMALETLHRFIVVLSQSSCIGFEAGESQVTVDYQATDPTVVYRRQDAEFAIAFILHQLQLITEDRLRPIRVDFEHDKPADISTHKTLFQCPIYFNRPINRLYFTPELLNLPVKQGNERLYQALEPYLERQREARADTDELLPRITRIIAADLSSGVPPLTAVSEQLGMSIRTLQRRLKKHEIEFSALVEEIRRELAIAYIKDSDYSITEISVLVGYAEAGSFTRAFRRWTDQTPQEFRASRKKPSP